MKVIASDKFVGEATIKVDFYNGQFINVDIQTEPMEEVLKHADFITLHVPAQKNYVIGKAEFDMMKDGAAIINAARGGVIDEVALVEALDSNKLSFAGLDTYEDEPKPAIKVLMNPKISLTPHIGAATEEAQDRIGTELAAQITSLLKN
jgi:D-3-phosphoglycerate dehydrogenase